MKSRSPGIYRVEGFLLLIHSLYSLSFGYVFLFLLDRVLVSGIA